MTGNNNDIFFFWHCRNGYIPKSVYLYGSWNDFIRPISLKFNDNSMFGQVININKPNNKGTFYYYYEVDGERKTDHTKAIITNESEEYNVIQLPLKNEEKETCRLFKELINENENNSLSISSFKGNQKRTIEDLSYFNEEIISMFNEWNESVGFERKSIRGKIRLKLLNEIGCLPNLSMEENIIEFRRNIAVLRIKLKQIQMQNEKRITLLNDEKEKAINNLQEIWKKEREKWRNIMQKLKIENQALKNGRFNKLIQGKDLNDKDAIISSQKQQIESLQFETSQLKKQQETIMKNDTIIQLSESLNTLKTEYNSLRKIIKQHQKTYSEEMGKTTETTLTLIENYNSNLLNMTNKYKEAMQLKRKYFNEIQELKGNIRVFVRSRPILPIDGNNQKSIIKFLDNNSLEIDSTSNDKPSHLFTFDKVFDTKSTQEMVYKNVSPFIESVMDGYNCCIFAFGQTGSGKTFTMQGNKTNPGVNIRALQHLFRIKQCRKPHFQYNIKMSMIEIYNEKIRDLLVKEQKVYKIRQKSTENYIENLSIHQVFDEIDVYKLMNKGIKNRSIGCTKSNEKSSRSHMILTISVIGKNNIANLTYFGKLHLIDLAGSERVKKSGVDGIALKEALNINKSLSSLGDCISALSKKSKHIPFRNSTLTYMLQDSLGGNSKCLMFNCLSPAQNHYHQTLNALKFAKRAKTVQLGPTKKSILYHGHQSNSKSKIRRC